MNEVFLLMCVILCSEFKKGTEQVYLLRSTVYLKVLKTHTFVSTSMLTLQKVSGNYVYHLV
jgi:hypothetical protein